MWWEGGTRPSSEEHNFTSSSSPLTSSSSVAFVVLLFFLLCVSQLLSHLPLFLYDRHLSVVSNAWNRCTHSCTRWLEVSSFFADFNLHHHLLISFVMKPRWVVCSQRRLSGANEAPQLIIICWEIQHKKLGFPFLPAFVKENKSGLKREMRARNCSCIQTRVRCVRLRRELWSCAQTVIGGLKLATSHITRQ